MQSQLFIHVFLCCQGLRCRCEILEAAIFVAAYTSLSQRSGLTSGHVNDMFNNVWFFIQGAMVVDVA
ncbi:hypothetical protein PSSHI_46560 [Photobacterium sp. R1]